MECTHHLRCSEADRIRWFELREHAHNLIELGNVAREDGYISEFVLNSSFTFHFHLGLLVECNERNKK